MSGILNYSKASPSFLIQWHVTHKCKLNCKHCYISSRYNNNKSGGSKIQQELNTSDLLELLDHIASQIIGLGASLRINFTGGDPLLRSDIPTLISHANKLGIGVGILGNPDLLNLELARTLSNSGLRSFQLSIDGLEKTHDLIRGRKGSFKKTLDAIRILQIVGIDCNIMTTVNRLNFSEFGSIVKLVVRERVNSFAFARTVPIGNANKRICYFSPEEYRNFLVAAEAIFSSYETSGVKTTFKKKDNLWRLLYWELGKFQPIHNDGIVRGGCSIGYRAVTISPDGIVYPCARLPQPIGDLRSNDFLCIFLESSELEKLRQIDRFEKCKSCPLLLYCRGCPAVSFGYTGSYFSPDPQCWKGD